MRTLVQVGEGRPLLGRHERPVIARRPRKLRRASELGSPDGGIREQPRAAELEARPRRGSVVADLLRERQRLGRVRFRSFELARPDRDVGATVKRACPKRGLAVPARLHGARMRQLGLGEATVRTPPAIKRRAEAYGELGLATQRALDRRRQVGRLRVEELEELELATGLEMGAGLLGEGEEVVAVAGPHRFVLTGLCQPLEPVLAHGLEQAVAHPGLGALGDHQRLVDQRSEQVEHVLGLDSLAGADRLCRLEGKAAGEDGQAAKQGPLLIGEQLVTPLDRGAQGLKPRKSPCAGRR